MKSMMICKVGGARLENHLIQSQNVFTVLKCIMQCTEHPDCVSLNYITSSGVCELNDVVSSLHVVRMYGDYDNTLDADYIHYTSQLTCGDTY